ncbi:hypothetical protein HanIR_Chr09g0416881 [Helianthus annuus]|nr:hypothetical protein HanIR_Chr09g0416881 [Helianthus annuus]
MNPTVVARPVPHVRLPAGVARESELTVGVERVRRNKIEIFTHVVERLLDLDFPVNMFCLWGW